MAENAKPLAFTPPTNPRLARWLSLMYLIFNVYFLTGNFPDSMAGIKHVSIMLGPNNRCFLLQISLHTYETYRSLTSR